ncbi:hypothetical protein Dsin_016306 [Dipteronia sinensis]|uniref:Ubiquitin carboxyl-terminal hydrolase n=1 Tax=Dipteronia sinensis TaxID=43782 RepID=A0AAE0AE90_9ROSI|nr:hypothetical protein Dsin_016306 [Dipteronia sinensis]
MRSELDTNVKAIIQSLKNGAFSHFKWVSTSGPHISLVGILGAAGAGFVFALKRDVKFGNLSGFSWLSDRENRSENLCLVPGLQNHGNNCFLNVVLQALASCSYFLPFLQKAMEECEEEEEDLPLLTIALATLLEELSSLCEKRVVLSPREVMLALELYVQNFNLTSQQDAAEAFLHLLSSLREEFSECYSPSQISLVDAFFGANFRFLSPKKREDESEQERWQNHFFGPFDGILGSILTCQSCSSQISLDYQFFHSLSLLPVLNGGSTIMVQCALEDCLKQFFTAERVENYLCSRCWHIAAIKYLSAIGVNEMEIEKIRRCSVPESCDCRSLLQHKKLPWSNNFSHTLKQQSISRCPKILCIHLQRASINMIGELVKLQGHIAFPLILDLFPFMRSGVGIKDLDESWHRGQARLQHKKPSSCPNYANMKYDAKMLNCMYGVTGENISFKVLAADEFETTATVKAVQGESESTQTEGCCNTVCTDMHMQSDNEEQVNAFSQICPSESYLYRLVSVVEHFGRVGGGHYTVYRSVRAESDTEDRNEHAETAPLRWFSISDSDVFSVSVKDVLAAEASLLFYERITES